MSNSTGTLSLALVAIVIGLVGTYAARTVLHNEQPAPPRPQTVTVPLATTDLPAGRTISLGDVGLVPMTREAMKEKNMPLTTMMIAPEQIIGRTLRAPIKQGQPFETTSLYLEGTKPNVAEKLKPGYRAVSLQLPAVRGGTVVEGTYVDILFRSQPRAAQDDRPAIPETTVVLIEGVEVLAVERPVAVQPNSDVMDIRYRSGGPPADPTVTLSVTAQQAKILRTVEGRGEISLVPRAIDDVVATSPQETDQLTLEALLGIGPPTPDPQPVTTEIYRRGQREVIQFEQDRRLGVEVVSAPPIPVTDPAGMPNLGPHLPASSATANTP